MVLCCVRGKMGTIQSRILAVGIACLVLLPTLVVCQDTSPDKTAESLSRLIEKHRSAGRRTEAERLLRRKMALEEQTFGSQSTQVAQDLDTLADVYREDGKYAEAETALENAIAIFVALDDPQSSRNNYRLAKLAAFFTQQRRFTEAEQLYQEVLTRQMTDAGHEDFTMLADLANVYHLAKDYSKAEEINNRTLHLELESEQPGSGLILGTIERLGAVYEEQGKYAQAEALYRNAVESSQAFLRPGDLTIIANLNDLGLFYERRERFEEAETFYKRALDQFGGTSDAGLMDSNFSIVIRNYVRVLRLMGRIGEAEQYEAKSKLIDKTLAATPPTR